MLEINTYAILFSFFSFFSLDFCLGHSLKVDFTNGMTISVILSIHFEQTLLKMAFRCEASLGQLSIFI